MGSRGQARLRLRRFTPFPFAMATCARKRPHEVGSGTSGALVGLEKSTRKRSRVTTDAPQLHALWAEVPAAFALLVELLDAPTVCALATSCRDLKGAIYQNKTVWQRLLLIYFPDAGGLEVQDPRRELQRLLPRALLRVSGAGSAFVNGYFEQKGDGFERPGQRFDRPRFVKLQVDEDPDDVCVLDCDFDGWALISAEDEMGLYTHDSTATLPPMLGWCAYHGSQPCPTVSFIRADRRMEFASSWLEEPEEPLEERSQTVATVLQRIRSKWVGT